MDKDYNLNDGVKIKMDQFDFIMMEKTVEEFVRRKAKSSLKEGSQHNDFVGAGSGNVFAFSRPPLEYDTVEEKMVLDELEEPTLINGRRLEHAWVRGGHGERSKSLGEK
jgi:hypothetical protein